MNCNCIIGYTETTSIFEGLTRPAVHSVIVLYCVPVVSLDICVLSAYGTAARVGWFRRVLSRQTSPAYVSSSLVRVPQSDSVEEMSPRSGAGAKADPSMYNCYCFDWI